ncbi:MAG: hypothetical protein V1875_09975 [Candidatus Altiarchaeota archaeon]
MQKVYRRLAFGVIFLVIAYYLEEIAYGLFFLVSTFFSSELKEVFAQRKITLDGRKRIRI